MEQPLLDYSCFTQYQNRQVVLNYYEDEDFLWKRDGFQFESVQLKNGQLSFVKKDRHPETINLAEFKMASINADFPNYYILRNGTDRLEIYFPS